VFKRLTSIFLFLALCGSIVSGMPLHAEKMNGTMMHCCKKAKSKEQTPQASLARLCCAVNCTEPSPNSPGASFNFSPSAIIISDSIIKQIAALISAKEKPVSTVAVSLERARFPRKIPPKYIQHHSILI
jgi:hypothetical protein